MTCLGRELFKFFRRQVIESDCLINASIVPLAVLVIKTFYPGLVSNCITNVLIRIDENL
jgi:hypothetical protein